MFYKKTITLVFFFFVFSTLLIKPPHVDAEDRRYMLRFTFFWQSFEYQVVISTFEISDEYKQA